MPGGPARRLLGIKPELADVRFASGRLAGVGPVPDHPNQRRVRDELWLDELEFLPPPDETLLSHADYDDGGPCQLSHLGAGTLANSGSIKFTPTVRHGRGTFTTAPRPMAIGSWARRKLNTFRRSPTALRFHGMRVVTGGTGRFAGHAAR